MDTPATLLAKVRLVRGRLATTAALLDASDSPGLERLATIEGRLDRVVADVALINRHGEGRGRDSA